MTLARVYTRFGITTAALRPDEIVGLRVAFADMAVRDRVKMRHGTQNDGSDTCATFAWTCSA